MIRWYDYVAAVIAADLILGVALMALTNESAWISIFAGVAVFGIWDFWNFYCQWRKANES